MGLLSDPSLTPQSKLGRALAKHNRKFCALLYLIGIGWFICLSHSNFNHGTYLSENALSPGLVYPEVKQDSSRLAQSLLEELQREQIHHKSTTPHAWIMAKMKQIGLETHVHNFTLNYPFTGGKSYEGKNIYGILRAPRIGSTEGIVFSAPYRSPSSVHTDITSSVPLLLAFAEFARKKNYWAKDLIFLVTEEEQLGMQAWLKAYHEGDTDQASSLKCGYLPARSGALQAALNLEIQGFEIDYIDVKIEGLNGQLPNLDMFNLIQRITSREGISSGYKQTLRKRRRNNQSDMENNLKHMVAMLLSQTTGIPTGNHGLFHRYRIEALTLEAVKRPSSSNTNKHLAALPLLKTIEGTSRSLNNLLERFHQSFFFYILVQTDRFVSIGDYIACLILMAGPLLIKAFLLWLSMEIRESKDSLQKIGSEEESIEPSASTVLKEDSSLLLRRINLYLLGALSLGVLCNVLPFNQFLRSILFTANGQTPIVLNSLLALVVMMGVIFPFLFKFSEYGLEFLHIRALVILGTSLIVVGLLNFALGFLIAMITAPLAIMLDTNVKKSVRKTYSVLYALVLNPYVIIYTIVLICTLYQFTELVVKDVALRAVTATMDAVVFSLMDNIIYSNWLYTIVTAVFLPQWVLWWTLALCRQADVNEDKKTN